MQPGRGDPSASSTSLLQQPLLWAAVPVVAPLLAWGCGGGDGNGRGAGGGGGGGGGGLPHEIFAVAEDQDEGGWAWVGSALGALRA